MNAPEEEHRLSSSFLVLMAANSESTIARNIFWISAERLPFLRLWAYSSLFSSSQTFFTFLHHSSNPYSARKYKKTRDWLSGQTLGAVENYFCLPNGKSLSQRRRTTTISQRLDNLHEFLLKFLLLWWISPSWLVLLMFHVLSVHEIWHYNVTSCYLLK